MEKSKFIMSLFSMFFSVFVLIMVSFAWFTLTPVNTVQPLSLTVQSTGLVSYFEIHYYTVDAVYRRDSETGTLFVFDPTSETDPWVLPVYEDFDEAEFDFSGIIMNQYDPLIPIANLFNNIIIEIYLEFGAEDTGNARLSTIANPAFAAEAVNEFAPENPEYFSFFAYLQMLMSEDYRDREEGENLYQTLTDLFDSRDASEALIYERVSFYGDNDTYAPSIDFPEFAMSQSGVTLYFNFSYFEE